MGCVRGQEGGNRGAGHRMGLGGRGCTGGRIRQFLGIKMQGENHGAGGNRAGREGKCEWGTVRREEGEKVGGVRLGLERE